MPKRLSGNVTAYAAENVRMNAALSQTVEEKVVARPGALASRTGRKRAAALRVLSARCPLRAPTIPRRTVLSACALVHEGESSEKCASYPRLRAGKVRCTETDIAESQPRAHPLLGVQA